MPTSSGASERVRRTRGRRSRRACRPLDAAGEPVDPAAVGEAADDARGDGAGHADEAEQPDHAVAVPVGRAGEQERQRRPQHAERRRTRAGRTARGGAAPARRARSPTVDASSLGYGSPADCLKRGSLTYSTTVWTTMRTAASDVDGAPARDVGAPGPEKVRASRMPRTRPLMTLPTTRPRSASGRQRGRERHQELGHHRGEADDAGGGDEEADGRRRRGRRQAGGGDRRQRRRSVRRRSKRSPSGSSRIRPAA